MIPVHLRYAEYTYSKGVVNCFTTPSCDNLRFGLDDFLAAVCAALAAHSVAELICTALGALGELGGGQLPHVGTTLISS